MDGLDKENTYVLLIGSSNYPNWEVMNIPNVKVNIQELESLLSDPFYCGIPSNKMKVVLDQNLEDTNIAIQEFFDGIHTPKANVILYYSGHGLQSVKAMDDLFLATRNIREKAFEASSIRISELRSMFSECVANRKILLLDCCYAGKIAKGFMGDDASQTVARLNEFEGTYIMAASSEYERARFDPEDPNSPTKFTGKFIDVVKNGIGTDDEYCTLNSIYWQIQNSFNNQVDAPKPIQVSKNNIGVFPLFKNIKFVRIPKDEQEWNDVVKRNTINAYNAFIDKFPESKYADEAKKRIEEAEDEAAWKKAANRNTIGGYREYLSYYTKYVQEARKRLNDLAIVDQENDVWQLACNENKIEFFSQYLQAYPNGKYVAEANAKISILERQELGENYWNNVDKQSVSALKEFVKKYQSSYCTNEATLKINSLQRNEEERKKVEEQNRLKDIEDINRREAEKKFRLKHIEEEKQRELKEQLIWDQTNSRNTYEAFQKYLTDYPEGEFVNEAKQIIDKLRTSKGQENGPPINIHPIILQYWKFVAGLLVILTISMLIITHFRPIPPYLIDKKVENQGIIPLDTLYVADTAKVFIQKSLSKDILSQIKVFAEATPLYTDYFKQLLDSIKIAPKSQQDLPEVKKFVENCKIAKEVNSTNKAESSQSININLAKQSPTTKSKSISNTYTPIKHEIKYYTVNFRFQVTASKPLNQCDLYIDDKFIKKLFFLDDGTGAVENSTQIEAGEHKLKVNNVEPSYDDVTNDVSLVNYLEITQNCGLVLTWDLWKPPGWVWTPRRVVKIDIENNFETIDPVQKKNANDNNLGSGQGIKVGDTYEGGIIIEMKNDKHGVVVAPQDIGKFSYNEANRKAKECNVGKYSNWRLPDDHELLVLSNLQLIAEPENYQQISTWRSTVAGGHYIKKSEKLLVRLVRDF